jgi:hypothetical protein
VLDCDILLVRAWGRITGCATDACAHGRPDRTSHRCTRGTAYSRATRGAARFSQGQGREDQDGRDKHVSEISTHQASPSEPIANGDPSQG